MQSADFDQMCLNELYTFPNNKKRSKGLKIKLEGCMRPAGLTVLYPYNLANGYIRLPYLPQNILSDIADLINSAIFLLTIHEFNFWQKKTTECEIQSNGKKSNAVNADRGRFGNTL